LFNFIAIIHYRIILTIKSTLALTTGMHASAHPISGSVPSCSSVNCSEAVPLSLTNHSYHDHQLQKGPH
jgi:hypothetical protein